MCKVELNGGLRSAHHHILSHCKEPDHLPPLQASITNGGHSFDIHAKTRIT